MEDLALQEYLTYAWNNLFFLRPQWFWAFLPIGVIALLLLLNHRRQAQWKRAFSNQLLPYLTIEGTKQQIVRPKVGLLLLLALMTLGMAGPTWEQIERPGKKTEAALAILLDLSRSMLVEDIQPNRIERAKLKIKDLFKAQPNIRTALVAYAGTAHTVVPFSKDYRTIARQMDALRPGIMPVRGSNLEEALNLADSLLNKVDAPSTILVVTDNIQPEVVDRLARMARETHVEIMTISTPNGGVIPTRTGSFKDETGNTVVPRLDIVTLDAVGAIENINVVTVTLDDSDVKILSARLKQNLEFIIDPETAEEEWKDAGYWLLFPIVLLSLFWFHRGRMVHWCWVLLLVSSCSTKQDRKFVDLFFNKDQQGQRLYNKGEKAKAAELFETGSWKGYTYYELGDLESAANAYSQDISATGFYNQGVVYTQLGDLESARQAFQSAIELDPDMVKASTNLSLVTIVLDSIAREEALELGSALSSKESPKDFQESMEFQDERDMAQKSDEKYAGKGDVQEMETKEVNEDEIDIFEFNEKQVISQSEAQQSLLRQVNEDPSIFLWRKFAYQNRKRKEKIKPPKEVW